MTSVGAGRSPRPLYCQDGLHCGSVDPKPLSLARTSRCEETGGGLCCPRQTPARLGRECSRAGPDHRAVFSVVLRLSSPHPPGLCVLAHAFFPPVPSIRTSDVPLRSKCTPLCLLIISAKTVLWSLFPDTKEDLLHWTSNIRQQEHIYHGVRFELLPVLQSGNGSVRIPINTIILKGKLLYYLSHSC